MAEGRLVKRFDLDDLVVDEAFQPREGPLNEEHVADMAEALRQDRELQLPPVVACVWGGRHHLTQGFHRVAAYRQAGRETVPCRVIQVAGRADAVVNAMCSNREHRGLRRSNADKRRAAAEVLRVQPGWADGKVAKEVGVDPKTVAAERARLRATREIPESATRVGCDGRARPVRPAAQRTFEDLAGEAVRQDKTPDHCPAAADGPVAAEQGATGAPSGGGRPAADAAVRKAGEYPPDGRFMPHADDAAKVVAVMAGVKQRLEKVRADMRSLFKDPRHPVAARMHYHASFDASLTAMLDDLATNSPTHTCPHCAGTGEADGEPCRTCDGYGLIDGGSAGRLKAAWKATGDKYDDLCKMADLSEVEA